MSENSNFKNLTTGNVANPMLNETKVEPEIQTLSPVGHNYFGITGENGMSIVDNVDQIPEAVKYLKNVNIKECSSELEAQKFVYTIYISQFVARNHHLGILPNVPMNVHRNVLWIDCDYESREKTLKNNVDVPNNYLTR